MTYEQIRTEAADRQGKNGKPGQAMVVSNLTGKNAVGTAYCILEKNVWLVAYTDTSNVNHTTFGSYPDVCRFLNVAP